MFCQKNLIIIGKKAREGITHDSVVRTGLSEEATLNKVEPKCKTAPSGQAAGVAQLGPSAVEGGQRQDCTSGRQEEAGAKQADG